MKSEQVQQVHQVQVNDRAPQLLDHEQNPVFKQTEDVETQQVPVGPEASSGMSGNPNSPVHTVKACSGLSCRQRAVCPCGNEAMLKWP